MNDYFRTGLDLAAITNVIATLVGWLPSIAALLSIIWLGIQIYDWYKKRKIS